jgi:hypothetical protein
MLNLDFTSYTISPFGTNLVKNIYNQVLRSQNERKLITTSGTPIPSELPRYSLSLSVRA